MCKDLEWEASYYGICADYVVDATLNSGVTEMGVGTGGDVHDQENFDLLCCKVLPVGVCVRLRWRTKLTAGICWRVGVGSRPARAGSLGRTGADKRGLFATRSH